MLPIFPKFSKLKLQHKNDIEKYISKYHPYSDYNFTSLWTYNTEDTIEVSKLNGNLVVKFIDYMDLKPFYSFLGENKVEQTIDKLLEFSEKKGIQTKLKLIPQIVVDSNKTLQKIYNITEDPNNHDYIVSVKDIAELPEEKYKRKKYLVERFKRKYPNYKIEHWDLHKKINQDKLIDLFYLWEKRSGKERKDTENELIAVKRLFDAIDSFEVFALTIHVDEKLVAFNTYEKTHGIYGISSFQKADKTYTGIYSMLSHEAAKHLQTLGCEFINYEQDLGIEGLRLSKSLWKPVHFLKKYIISKK